MLEFSKRISTLKSVAYMTRKRLASKEQRRHCAYTRWVRHSFGKRAPETAERGNMILTEFETSAQDPRDTF